MRQRLFRWFFVSSFAGIVAVCALFFFVFYHTWHEEQGQALKQEAIMLSTLSEKHPLTEKGLLTIKKHLGSYVRITVIGADGTVLLDSDQDPKTMENHRDRPEVKAAMENGIGEEDRQSKTLQKRNYYCAVKNGNGEIIRISYVGNSWYSYLLQVLPLFILLVFCSAIISYFISRYLTAYFMNPLEAVIVKWGADGTQSTPIAPYPEFKPILDKLVEQKEAMEALHAAEGQRRREFSSNVSHELKSPLTVVSGYGEMLSQGFVKDKKEVAKMGKRIYEGAQRMLTIIDSLLHLAEVEHGGDDTPWVSVHLVSLVDRCVKEVGRNWALKHKFKGDLNEQLKWIRPEDEGEYVIQGNAVLLEEVVQNVIDNALKYGTSDRPIEVKLWEEADTFIILVEDKGQGIPPDKLDRIFERFYRVDESRTPMGEGGTGIGLSLVKHILSMHGGNIQINSIVGLGTTVEIRLPKGL